MSKVSPSTINVLANLPSTTHSFIGGVLLGVGASVPVEVLFAENLSLPEALIGVLSGVFLCMAAWHFQRLAWTIEDIKEQARRESNGSIFDMDDKMATFMKERAKDRIKQLRWAGICLLLGFGTLVLVKVVDVWRG